ncbi:MAG: hypothetical protein ACD_42C00153G0004, partial [uncultured bacterium]
TYDSTHHCLRGRSSSRVYRLGDVVRVQVARVDVDKRQIDFTPAIGAASVGGS